MRETVVTTLNGTRVLVTGATSGLGAAMASALVDAGARVMVTGRDRARAEETARGLGPSAVGCQLDVRDERSVSACVARAVEEWGGVEMLVNNAGIGMRTVNPKFSPIRNPSGTCRPPASATWWIRSSSAAS